MEIRVWKRVEGVGKALIKPARRSRLPPLLLQGKTPEELRDQIAEAVRVIYGDLPPGRDV